MVPLCSSRGQMGPPRGASDYRQACWATAPVSAASAGAEGEWADPRLKSIDVWPSWCAFEPFSARKRGFVG